MSEYGEKDSFFSDVDILENNVVNERSQNLRQKSYPPSRWECFSSNFCNFMLADKTETTEATSAYVCTNMR